MMRMLLGLTATTLVLSGCMGGLSGVRESPTRVGVHLYGAPEFPLDAYDGVSVHPLFGYSRIEGADMWTLGGQLRKSLDEPFWVGAEGSYLRLSSVNAFSIGALGGYDITGFDWPLSAYGYFGYLDAVGTGLFWRLGVEVRPPQLMKVLP